MVKKKLTRPGIPGVMPDIILEGTINEPQTYRGVLQTRMNTSLCLHHYLIITPT